MNELKRFADFDLCCTSEGEPIELFKLDSEFVFLAFDAQLNKMVELHILKSGLDVAPDPMKVQSVVSRLERVSTIDRSSCLPILKKGIHDGLIYYSAPILQSEPVEDFISRVGALPLTTSLVLSLQLCNELFWLKDHSEIFPFVGLEKLEMSLWEDTYLQLMITDYQLEQEEGVLSMGEKESQMVHWICRLFFLLLTGKSYQGDDIELISVLTALPTGLRLAFKQNLRKISATATLQGFRDELKTAVVHYTRAMQFSQQRRHLMAQEIGLPADVLLSNLPTSKQIETLEKTFEFVGGESPFTEYVARHRVSQKKYHLSLTQVCDYDVNLGCDEAWVVRPVRAMGTLQWSASLQEECQGMNLGRLVAERGHLNPVEVFQILEKIAESLPEASTRKGEDLYPYKIQLDTGHSLTSKNMDRLIQRRVDAWGSFKVKMVQKRTVKDFVYQGFFSKFALEHGQSATSANFMEHFIYLAVYMATGVTQYSMGMSFPSELKSEICEFLKTSLYATDELTPESFVQKFKELLFELKLLQDPAAVEVAPKKTLNLAPMTYNHEGVVDFSNYENAGVVSDFDTDFFEDDADEDSEMGLVGSMKASVAGFFQKWLPSFHR